ncbi:MAG: nitroreductase family protein [Methanobrevibacter sp.]|jgi:nitroreductase|nr:nitroreductase family protein [Candidatus Methanovirga basalitermitum]
MNVLEAINRRKSVRDYLDYEIDEKDVKSIVDSGGKAPKAGSFQITVVTNKELLNKINNYTIEGMKNSGNDFFAEKANTPGYNPLYSAPLVIFFSAPDENVFGALTVSAAAENAILAATALGYGTCYLVSPTFAFQTSAKDELIKELQLPHSFNPICAISIGKEGENNITNPQEEIDNVNFVK